MELCLAIGKGAALVRKPYRILLSIFLLVCLVCLATVGASAQSLRVQCPPSTITHPTAANNSSEPPFDGATAFATAPVANGQRGYVTPTSNVNGAIRCQQISGDDGYATIPDGTQTFMFSFGPLSGLADVAAGLPCSEFPNIFNTVYPYATPLRPGDPATSDGSATGAYTPGTLGAFAWNGAVGLIGDPSVLIGVPPTNPASATVTITVGPSSGVPAGGVTDVTINNPG